MRLLQSEWNVRIKFTRWRKGTIWNWFLIPSVELQQWQKCVTCPGPGDYYTVFICSQFLKCEVAIGLSRSRDGCKR